MDHSALCRLIKRRDEGGNVFPISAGLAANAFLQITQSGSDTAIVLHSFD
jgi:hypothetical protein